VNSLILHATMLSHFNELRPCLFLLLSWLFQLIVAGVRDLVQRTADGRTGRILGGRVIERSGGAVCGLHRARGDDDCGFLG
jgi:hypothetical protein